MLVCYDIEVEMYSDVIQCICCHICEETDTNIIVKKQLDFLDLPSFMNMLASIPATVVLVAHNGYGYDHLFILEHLCNAKEIFSDFTDLRLLEVEWGKARLLFRDTKAYISGPLAKIAQDMLGDKKMDCDLATASIADLLPYCRHDAFLVVRIMQYVQEHLLKPFDLCAQPSVYYGQADIAYRIVMAQVDTFTHTLDDTLHSTLSQSYYGGRVYSPIYGKHVKGHFCCIDIRSMYPASLCRRYPCGEITWSQSEVPSRLGIYFVEARKAQPDCIKMTKAIVPVRIGDQLVFASHGAVAGWYCTPDIAAMRLDGWNVVVYYGAVWNETTDILRTKYERLYNERKQYPKSHPKNHSLKIVLNSSYGKFCQIESSNVSRPKFVGWFCLAYTRLQLFHLMALSGQYPVLYGDTDSIFVSSKVLPLNPDICKNELSVSDSQITVDVESFHNSLLVLGKKTYALTNELKIRAKGVPNATYEQMKGALETPQTVKFVSKGSSAIKQTTRGNIVVSAHNLVDKKRRLTVNIPKYAYKCNNCSMFHTVTINCV